MKIKVVLVKSHMCSRLHDRGPIMHPHVRGLIGVIDRLDSWQIISSLCRIDLVLNAFGQITNRQKFVDIILLPVSYLISPFDQV